MCGIAGVISSNPEQVARVSRMTDVLAHRGPDDDGILLTAGAGLGHRRLSIIDIEGGRQPMSLPAAGLHIVFNGEIYNYRALRADLEREGVTFRTSSDTEVLLALYRRDGRRCVQALRGMFAFAIWDETRQQLFAARDRFGQKPFFYTRLPGGLAFASEIKGILAGGFTAPTPDLQALFHYMSLRYIPDDRTLFDGIAKLPPAHTLVYDAAGLRVERYWELSYGDKWSDDAETLLRETERRLREAVLSHTVADVPVGTFLSGGIDSSLVTGMLADQTHEPVNTFSVGVRDMQYDELPWARIVARRWNTRHREHVADPDVARLLPRLIWHMDEPSDPYALGVYLASQLASSHVKVVLTGDGGDEMFAGYDRFAGNRLVDLYATIPAPLRRSVLRTLVRRLPDSYGYKSLAQKASWVNEMSLASGGARYALSLAFLRFTSEQKTALFEPSALQSLPEQDSSAKILHHFDAGQDAPLDRMLRTDCLTRLPEHLLLLVDRMAMAHGLETRPPFVDHEFAEFAARLPCDLKLRGARLKYTLRQIARRYMPDQVVDRPKQGFGFPIARWFRTDLRPLLENVLAESRFAELGIFRAGEQRRLVEEHVSGRRDHNFRLWILLNLEFWHRMYIEGTSVGEMDEWLAARLHRCGAEAPVVAPALPTPERIPAQAGA